MDDWDTLITGSSSINRAATAMGHIVVLMPPHMTTCVVERGVIAKKGVKMGVIH